MARFTDIAKVAISVEVVQGGPIMPAPTASAPFGVAPPPGPGVGGSSTAPGGAPTGLQIGASMPPPGPLIRSDQAQPQPRMQTTQSLPETKAPGASKAFAAPKPAARSGVPSMPKPGAQANLLAPTQAAPSLAKKAGLYPLKISSVLAPAAPGLLSHITGGLGMHPSAMQGGLVDKALGATDAYGRASTLFAMPEMVASGAEWLGDKVVGTPATDTLGARKAAAFGLPTEPLPAGAMPPTPASDLMDLVRPFKHPIDATKTFFSGLGTEAERQLTQSMIERPVDIHTQMYQNHPKITN